MAFLLLKYGYGYFYNKTLYLIVISLPNFINVAISADGTKVVAGSFSNIGVWYSNNSGKTYTQSSPITNGNWSVAINRNGTKVIVGSRSNSGLWYSTSLM